MTPRDPQSYHFPPFRLDLRSGALYRQDVKISLRPKTFDTLVYLLRNQGRLVPKDELIEQIWADTFVTDDVLVQSIADIRRALGDDARNPTFVETVPRRGYVFIRALETVEPLAPAAALGREAGWPGGPPLGKIAPGTAPSRSSWALLILLVSIPALLAVAYLNYFPGRAADDPRAPPTSLAVSLFEVQSDDPAFQWLESGLPTLIQTGLWHWPEVPILTYSKLLEAGAHDPNREGRPIASEERNVAAARRLKAGYLVTGSCIKLGPEFQISAALIDLDSGREVVRLAEHANAPAEIFPAVDRLSLSILQALAYQRGLHGVQGPMLAESTTHSLKAYQHYVAGLKYFLKGGPVGAEKAELELEEAIRIDPSFAMAHFKLAQVQKWAQAWGFRTSDPRDSLQKALALSANLPETERLLFRGMQAWILDGDSAEALRIWRDLEARFPVFAAEARLPTMTIEILLESGKPVEALSYGAPLLDDPYLTNEAKAKISADLARASRQLGNFREAVQYGQQSLQLWPLEQGQTYLLHLVNLGRNYLALGEREKALSCFAQVREMAGREATHLTDAGWGFYMAGKRADARALAERARQANPGYGNAQHLAGWIELSDGQYLRAAESLKRAFQETPPQFGSTYQGLLLGDLPALYYAGVAYQKAAQPAPARELLQQLVSLCEQLKPRLESDMGFLLSQVLTLESLAQFRLGNPTAADASLAGIPEDSQNVHEWCVLRARVAAVAGQPDEALQWLRRGIQSGAREFQHLYDNPDFDSLRDTTEFSELLGR